ncbi:MAG: DUF2321 domain-containing protein [Terriglobia bacterium]|nr:DUF2321 domain-containing protein [Terriglobia bacterium]
MSEIVAIYCRNGHYVGGISVYGYPGHTPVKTNSDQSFCKGCGAPTINACTSCKEVILLSSDQPRYCGACGKPYPWTEATLTAAKEYTQELEELTAEDKAALIATFDDLVADTPRTELAAHRFKKLIRKSGPVAGEFLRKMIVDIASETAVKLLKP